MVTSDNLQDNSRKSTITHGDYVEGNKIIVMQNESEEKSINSSLPSAPNLLIGRDSIINEIHSVLDAHQSVSLHGMAGIGKTSIAAKVAFEREQTRNELVIWIKAGHMDLDDLFNEVGRYLGYKTISEVDIKYKIETVRKLLHDKCVNLVVLDDVWNRSASRTFAREGIPAGCKLLITGRKRSGIGYPIDVSPLKNPESEKLYREHSKVNEQISVEEICKLLAGHPMAIEIAGKLTWIYGFSPEEIILKLQKTGEKTKALALSKDAHDNMWATLQISYDSLGENEKKIFQAFGCLWVSSATSEMLELITKLDQSSAQDAIGNLVMHSLIHPEATLDKVRRYRLHDLSFDYAVALTKSIGILNQNNALESCVTYAKKYALRDRDSHNRIEAEKDNLLLAAKWAAGQHSWEAIDNLSLDLYHKSEFLRWRGYVKESTDLLDLGQLAASSIGNFQNQAIHLHNLGIAFRQLGQIEKGIYFHQMALNMMQQLGDKQGESDSLGEIGWANHRLGKIDEAISFMEKALDITREIGNKRWESIWIGTLGRVFSEIGLLDKAVANHKEALKIMRDIGDRRGEGARLGELGWDYLAMSNPMEAMENFVSAYNIAKEIGDRRREGVWLGSIGTTYIELGQLEKAEEALSEALDIAREIGHRNNEGEIIGSLGKLSLKKGDLDKAEELINEALSINNEIRREKGIGTWLFYLGEIYSLRARKSMGKSRVEFKNKAEELYKESIRIRREIRDPAISESIKALSYIEQLE